MKKMWFCLALLLVTSASYADPVSSFNDIEYWVGSGENQAVVVIDWLQDSSTEEAWAWGYRWNGTANSEDMLMAVVATDPRLYAKVGTRDEYGLPLYGLGYDLNDNGSFGISDGTLFNSEGIATTDNRDGATATDTGDLYKEGWYTGFWVLGASSNGNPYDTGHWDSSEYGMSYTPLLDSDWNGFTYETDWGFDSFPENPYAAPIPEPSIFILLAGGLFMFLCFRKIRHCETINYWI